MCESFSCLHVGGQPSASTRPAASSVAAWSAFPRFSSQGWQDHSQTSSNVDFVLHVVMTVEQASRLGLAAATVTRRAKAIPRQPASAGIDIVSRHGTLSATITADGGTAAAVLYPVMV